MSDDNSAARLALGGSTIRRRILELLMAEPDARLHLREIQRRVGTSPGTASRELGRLVAAGLAERQPEGHQVYFRIASTPYAWAFRTLLGAEGGATAPAPDDAIDVLARPSDSPLARQAATPSGRRPSAPLSADGGLAAPEAAPAAPSTGGIAGHFADREAPPRPPRTIAAHGPKPRRPDAIGIKAAARFAEILRPLYAGRLIGVFLYGARARGETKPDADIEIAVVLDEVPHYGQELERTSVTCAGLSLEYGVIVSRVFIPEAVWKTKTDGRLPAVRLEAVAV